MTTQESSLLASLAKELPELLRTSEDGCTYWTCSGLRADDVQFTELLHTASLIESKLTDEHRLEYVKNLCSEIGHVGIPYVSSFLLMTAPFTARATALLKTLKG